MSEGKKNHAPLENAPLSVQLAVDLIQLLEENKIDKQVAVGALEIVLKDFKNKQD
ncbi:DUF2496 domain-containing protein [Psychromonas sp. MB-3u-54]|uniref:YbaM family protein n=1 Tax=Psychromonas sp. MB-3u-54 TaxID=2058319 RepID=UPI000C330367|nr:YbaM family protein [Psychromonas sp. MB-3u-54]PKH01652.1 DUF2496 domain-containing protein [Psychromonas sp. MB-3u-54]